MANANVVFEPGSDEVTRCAIRVLSEHGLHSIRSFDLRSAMEAWPDCECPHHGSAKCTCQYVVLLVYGSRNTPVTVVVHTNSGRIDFRIMHDSTAMSDLTLAERIKVALDEVSLSLHSASRASAKVASDVG
ncbi:MAG: hypothetical protein A2Z37_06185 [Chloroflexi bacterium RBG_19FT_COMBO_62_14]|nr:MAG: hypothetical protein A2Z37_06185 [Chloroflexi bacterium RBG_19FT_COMBO_62_14]